MPTAALHRVAAKSLILAVAAEAPITHSLWFAQDLGWLSAHLSCAFNAGYENFHSVALHAYFAALATRLADCMLLSTHVALVFWQQTGLPADVPLVQCPLAGTLGSALP